MTKICSVENCERNVFSNGWCSMHYQRVAKHGDAGIAESRQRKFVTLNCEHCKDDFVMPESRYRIAVKHFGGRKYCTRECWKAALAGARVARPAPTFTCAHCGVVAKRKRGPSDRQYNLAPRFCGRECASLAGKNSVGAKAASTRLSTA